MAGWNVIKGNSSIQDIPIRDKNGDLLTDLAAATDIVFQVKTTKTAATAMIEKTAPAGGIEVDTPSTGYLRLTINPADTVNEARGRYKMALQIKWSATKIYEVDLKINNLKTDEFVIKQDTIQPSA